MLESAEGRFPRRCRLSEPDDYRRVFNGNYRSFDQNLIVFAHCNKLDYARLGLAVSRKKLRRAVDRNRLKRLVRESFRAHQLMLRGLDLVVVNRATDISDVNGHYLNMLSLHWQKLAKKCKRC